MFWIPPVLSELTPIMFDIELTHLCSEASIWFLDLTFCDMFNTIKIASVFVIKNHCCDIWSHILLGQT